MQQTTQLPTIKVVGIKTRTNTASEMNPATSKIGETVQKYFQNALSEKMIYRKKPGTTYCCYTDYESDLSGDYTFFMGEEVSSFDDLPEGFSTLTIPAQQYTTFTSNPGPMPDVCINLWQKIWTIPPETLGGTRSYETDFELYDERAKDPKNTVLDIYIGMKTSAPCVRKVVASEVN
ncbi:MAG: AraC family transcriptional regulator [Gammaproteobacteria bacterium]|nr:AraC family transcriptional regulator [Gammaproteobacteria bacterium]MBP9728591.1 AraC family transcriptional regulator [Gammaproteobacteria bacterium]